MKDKNPNLKLLDDGEGKPPQAAEAGILSHLRISVIATLVLAIICCGIYPLLVWAMSQAIFHDKANGSLITDDKGQIVGSRLIGQSFSDAKYFHPRPSAAGNGYDPTASGGSNLGPTSAKLINGTTKPSTQPAAPPATQPGAQASTAPATAPTTQPAVIVDYDGIKLRVLHYCDDNNIDFQLVQDDKPVDVKPYKTADGWDEVKLILAFNDADHPLTVKPKDPIPADAVTASGSGLDPHISVENAQKQIGRVASARKMTAEAIAKLIDENTDGRGLGILGEPGVNVLMLNLALDKVAPAAPPPAAPPSPSPTTKPVARATADPEPI